MRADQVDFVSILRSEESQDEDYWVQVLVISATHTHLSRQTRSMALRDMQHLSAGTQQCYRTSSHWYF